jgi:SAM-dependent methyltransferase
LLEIGSAAGYFLACAKVRGWDVTGIEPAATIAEWSRRYLHVPVHTGFYEQFEIADAALDAVVAIEVLEHVLDPLALARRIRRQLRPTGMLFLTTPNVECPDSRPGGPGSGILAPLDHLNLFSPGSLEEMLRRAGFGAVRVETDGPNGFQLQAYAHVTSDAAPARRGVADLERALAERDALNEELAARLMAAEREIHLLQSSGAWRLAGALRGARTRLAPDGSWGHWAVRRLAGVRGRT